MSDERFNGWTNYETWNVKLWIDNDEGSQCYWRDRARDILHREMRLVETEDDFEGARSVSVSALAGQFKAENEECVSKCRCSGCCKDMLTACMGRVNWHEIAESIISDEADDFKPEADKSKAQADARLIAAAPELLAMLQHILEIQYLGNDDYDMIESVVAKATGEAT